MTSRGHRQKTGSQRPTTATLVGCACILWAVGAVSAAGGGDPPCYYEVRVLDLIPDCGFGGDPGGTTPLAIADNGWITGRHPQCNGTGQPWVLLNTGGTAVQELIPPFEDVYRAEGHDITTTGLIVGNVDFTGVNTRGFIYDHGTGQWELVAPSPKNTFVELDAINDAGTAVGTTGNHITGPSPLAVIWHNGQLVDLNPQLGSAKSRARDINAAGAVTGWTGDSSLYDARAFVWDEGSVTILPVPIDAITSVGLALNRHNSVAGAISFEDPGFTFGRSQATLWRDGDVLDLGILPGFLTSAAFDVNDHHVVVGVCSQAVGNINAKKAFIWQDGVLTALDDLVDPELQLTIREATSINDSGQICAIATHPDFIISFAVVLTPPNPADINGDCIVDVWDLIALLNDWGAFGSPADFDGNGVVNVVDLLFLLGRWG